MKGLSMKKLEQSREFVQYQLIPYQNKLDEEPWRGWGRKENNINCQQ
jgi:hypothetical protein